MAGRPPFYETPEEFYDAIESFRKRCEDEENPFTLTGLLLHLGFATKRSYYQQAKRGSGAREGGVTWGEVVDYGCLLFEHEHEKGLHKGGNVGGHIFGLKNANRRNENGWNDKVEHEHSGPGGDPIEVANLQYTDEERLIRIQKLITRAEKRAKAIEQSAANGGGERQESESCGTEGT